MFRVDEQVAERIELALTQCDPDVNITEDALRFSARRLARAGFAPYRCLDLDVFLESEKLRSELIEWVAVSPLPIADEEVIESYVNHVLLPTLKETSSLWAQALSDFDVATPRFKRLISKVLRRGSGTGDALLRHCVAKKDHGLTPSQAATLADGLEAAGLRLGPAVFNIDLHERSVAVVLAVQRVRWLVATEQIEPGEGGKVEVCVDDREVFVAEEIAALAAALYLEGAVLQWRSADEEGEA